jgi:large subunit ribosomal protein L9e
MVRQLLATRFVEIPEDVKLSLDGRKVSVEGKLGKLSRDFRHVSLDMRLMTPTQLRVDLWFGNRKQLACVRTICSLIENMITGVRVGFRYKMRFVYAHFPINVTLEGRTVEVRNFLGEKRVRKIVLSEGVEYVRSAEIKDQIELTGIDLAKVSQDAANITQSCLVKRKDIRKFLDGIYVSEKGHMNE